MLHTTKKGLAKEIGVDRTTIDRMIKRGEVRVLTNNQGKVHYIHTINGIRDLVG